MRRITLWLLSTVSALILLFSYRTSTMGPGGPTSATAGQGGAGLTGGPAAGSRHSGSAGGDSSAGGDKGSVGAGIGSGTFDGTVIQTRKGPVQVRINVAGGRITKVTMLRVPHSNNQDRQINGRAVPILSQETLQAQSADIDTVSGATVTSDGYRQSLQAALDAAHLR